MTGLRLALVTAAVMIAFAGNSVLNRIALASGGIDALGFALLRVAAGAVMLVALVLWRGGGVPLGRPARWLGAAALTAYLVGFSLAYAALDAGLGALILFGGVQVTMFVGAVLSAEPVPARRWAGALLALAGLGWLLWPGSGLALSLPHAGLMGIAAVGWGVYSLLGRGAGAPLAATAASFVLAVPLVALAMVIPHEARMAPLGVSLAIVSGAVTSGLGYALWYAVVPRLGAARAAAAQLTVPVIAALGGAVLLGEAPGARFWVAAVVVTLGVALASVPGRR